MLARRRSRLQWRVRLTASSVYISTLQDRAIPERRQRLMAARTGSVLEIDSDHSPYLSRPAETADLVLQAWPAVDQGDLDDRALLVPSVDR